MVISESLKDCLKMKTALFDTCVLSTIRTHIRNSDVQDFLKMLDVLNCKSAITDLVKLEFLRDANKYTELVERKAFISTLCQEFSLPVTQDMYRDAIKLSYIHVRHQNKGIELVDLITTTFLKHFAHKQGLVLVTLNHVDYPLTVHDRVGTIVLDLDKTLATLGFYMVNPAKWSSEISELVHSPEWKS